VRTVTRLRKPLRGLLKVEFRRDAVLSSDGLYRYRLTRRWDTCGFPVRWVAFCGLNPSTADALVDDPTIRREVDFACQLGATGLIKVNLYGYRATDPKDLLRFITQRGHEAARGPANFDSLLDAASLARSGRGLGVFAAWGAVPKALRSTVEIVSELLGGPLMCLGLTKGGEPRHPLYLPKTANPQEWRSADALRKHTKGGDHG
jgi:hypothetical protein